MQSNNFKIEFETKGFFKVKNFVDIETIKNILSEIN